LAMISHKSIVGEINDVLEAARECAVGDITRRAECEAALSHAIFRFAPPGSEFRAQASAINNAKIDTRDLKPILEKRLKLTGVLRAVRAAYERGYLQTVQEIVHAELFADFLTMAEYLLEEGYKDPSAVIVGGVLEEHLRKLCAKNGIAVMNPTDGKARKSDALNADLAKQGVYDKLELKNVLSWLDLRNKAAHGEYDKYDRNHVNIMLRGV
jgi:hypothetical protein